MSKANIWFHNLSQSESLMKEKSELFCSLFDLFILNVSLTGKSEISKDEFLDIYEDTREDFKRVVNPQTLQCKEHQIEEFMMEALHNFDQDDCDYVLIAKLNKVLNTDIG